MAAPTNTSAATAIDLGTLPATVTQNVHDAGITYTVWYKYTALATERMIGLFGYGDATTYRPTTAVFTLVAGVPVAYLNIAGQNLAIQLPVTAGVTYYFSFTPNAGNPSPAVLSIDALTAPTLPVPAGTILVPDDTGGFPAVLLSAADGTILNAVVPFPDGETGDALASGLILVEDQTAGDLKRYDADLNLLGSVAFAWVSTNPQIRTNHGSGVWYVGDRGGGGSPASIRTVLSTGAFGPTIWTLPTAGLTGMAAANDDSILYFSGQTSSLNTQVQRWDLVANAPLTDLVADIGGTYTVFDMLMLADNTLLVGYKQNSPRDVQLRRYSLAGALLTTYSMGSGFSTQGPHLAYAVDDPTSFWLWTHLTGVDAGKSRFFNLRVSDGATLITFDTIEYEGGTYQPTETPTPLARFGHSFSCPFFLLRTAVATPTTVGPTVRSNTDGTVLVTVVVAVAGCPAPQPVAVSGPEGCVSPQPGAN